MLPVHRTAAASNGKDARMLCDKCKKKEATIHVKKVSGGKIESMHLCADCAKEKEDKGVLGALGFNLAEVLFNIGEFGKLSPDAVPEQSENISDTGVSCPACSWNMEKLQRFNGKLGCPECYKTFEPVILDALKRIQRGQVHIGKQPGLKNPIVNVAALRIEIARAKKELAVLVSREEYELAAVCRDKLNDLNRKLGMLEHAEAENEQ